MKQRILTALTLLLCFAFTAVNAQDNYNATTMGEKVYLETANWGQNSPFNKQIFTSYGGSTNAKAGCVPTAYAIVMRYHGFPAEGTANTLYNCQADGYVEITDRVYDFSKMPLTNGSGWTEEQQAEVAKFFSHVLHACLPSSIGTNATTANEEQTSAKLNRYFDYQLINASYQANFTMEQWAEKLRESIDNGCPVPYASNNSGTGDTRHMFVVDGYTDNGYFHFNFGWAGSGNGWFKLDDITPSQGDNYSWKENSQHYALFNLAPNNLTKRTVTATATPSNMGTVSINGGAAGSKATANLIVGATATLTATPATGYAFVSWTKNGEVVGTNNPIQVKVGESGNDYVANFDETSNVVVEKTYTFKFSDVTTSGVNGAYCSTWTTSDGIVLSCTKGSEPAYALSTSANTFYAKAPVGNSEDMVSDITYTLTAPAGYIIKSYSFKGKSPSGSYTIDVTVGGNTTNVTNASAGVVISASDVNAQSTSFVLGSTYTGRAGLSIMEDGVTVTIQSEGGEGVGGGSTPTPDPEPEPEPISAKIIGVNRVPETKCDLSQGLKTGYYLLKQVNNNNSAAGGQGVGWIKAASESADASVTSKNTGTPSATGCTYIWYVEVVDAANKTITISTANKIASWQTPYQRQKDLVAYANKATLKYHTGTVNLSGNATPKDGSCFISNEDGTAYVHFSGDNLGSWNDTNQNSMFMVEFYKLNNEDLVVEQEPEEVIPSNEKTLTVTYSGATWGNKASDSNWWEYVTTTNNPAVTVRAANEAKAIGHSTVSGVKHPYLLDGNSFAISLPANCTIVGYKLTYFGHNLNTKTFTYTGNNGNIATETVGENNVDKILTVTGLDCNEIAISVSDQTSQAGVIIKALEITYVEEESEPVPFKVEIANWRDNNPNTHLGTITVGGTPLKLTPEHLTASELEMPLAAGTTLAFTRKYRGFEFDGFYIGTTSLGTNPTLTAENIAAISDATPLVAKFTATDDVTLFYDDDTYSYRIPAIAKTGTNRLVAISDYRHSHDDIGRDSHYTGTLQVDLVMRTSEDNGATWSAKQTIAEGNQNFGYGDAAVAVNGENILVMAVAGNVFFTNATATNKQKTYRIYSTNNGQSWEKQEVSSNLYTLFPNANGMFFGSGKLVVDPDFNGTGNARVYGAMLLNDGSNYVLYSDNWGETWNILGGGAAASANEPKVEILPNGQILLSSRRSGGRTFNVFTYTDKANNAGTWSTSANGCGNGGNATNGEIICLDAKRPNGQPTKILLQSQPNGSNRENVSIWYKEISASETYTGTSIASDWAMGKQVSTQLSAYSAMCLQANGEIAFFFEEAPCHNDDHTYGYSMVYVPLTIEEITKNNFLSPSAVVETKTVDVTLTDEQGNTYTHQFDYLPGDAAAIDAALMSAYPFITELGEGNLQGSGTAYTYTNTVTLPFKVSNAETTVWHNIYWPANDTSPGKYYPIYLLSTGENDTYVAKKTETKHYGESSYNTLNWADELSWAVYSVDGTLNFKFKNKLTGKFMAVNGVVSSGSTNNVIYTDEANATTFTLEKYTGTNTYYGNYAIKSVYNGTTGYVCNTSVGHPNATNYTGTGHAGAWAKFVEAPDYQAIVDALTASIAQFDDGEGNYMSSTTVAAINISNIENMPLNTIKTNTATVQTVKDSYREITLTVPKVNNAVPGTVSIAGEVVNNKFVPGNTEIELLATANPGYRFVNWTRTVDAPQASAAARTVEARNGDFVSKANPYKVTLSEALNLTANFEEITVNVVLTEIIGTNNGQTNEYRLQLSGFTTEITKEAVAAKLVEIYPYITLGEIRENENIDNGKLEVKDNSYTYTNNVILPFKVSNTENEMWHNIYWPANDNSAGYPVYLSGSEATETYVSKVTEAKVYGESSYNTLNNGNKIAWAVYSVKNSFEFIFKNKVTGKYIQVTSVASGDAQNVVYVENAEDATAFTLLKDTGTRKGDYALVAKVGETTGYLCSTSATGYSYATHYNDNEHQGAWFKFVEAPNYESMLNDTYAMYYYYAGVGTGKCVITDELQPIVENLGNYDNWGNITYNNINAYAAILENANKWPLITVTAAEGGSVTINGESVSSKKAPVGHPLPIVATPAEGYSFVSWTKGDAVVEGAKAEYTYTVEGATTLTANFAKNSYTVSVTAGEGGSAMIGTETSATVEHGSEVELTATPNTGYEFAGWYNGDEFVSNEAILTFAVTSNINYTARFNEIVVNPTTFAIHVTVASTDGTVTNNATGNVKAVVELDGMDWVTDYDCPVGANITLIATNDYNSGAYLFDGWYKNGECVSNSLEYTIENVTEAATYQARFFRGCVVTGISNNNRFGYISSITLADGTSIGYDAANRAVVKAGTTVSINTFFNMYGYEVASWKDAEGNVVGSGNNLVVEVNGDVTYTANFEPASYNLTVRANDDSYGTVSATSGTSTGASIKVGHNMEATITATPAQGYHFVNWTKGTEVVSEDATYTIAGIADVENMVDVEYIANFEKNEVAEAGTYYRFAYEFDVPVETPANSAATRAVGDIVTYSIITANGTATVDDDSKTSLWSFTKDGYPAGLTLKATHTRDIIVDNKTQTITTSIKAINVGDKYIDLCAGGWTDDSKQPNNATFTLSVQNSEYKIVGYSIKCKAASNKYNLQIIPQGRVAYDVSTSSYETLSVDGLNDSETTFELNDKDNGTSGKTMYIDSFEVYIQEVGGGETPEPEPEPETEKKKFYIQSKAVSGTNNAMVMSADTAAASIFYYADSKLMSYSTGTFVNENGTTCGLQAYGIENAGEVVITENEGTATIAAPSYLHASVDGTKYYVSNCSGNATCMDHTNFIIEEVKALPVTISSAKYATFCAPVAVKIPEGVYAWYLLKDGIHTDYASMTEISGGVIPANTAVVIGSETPDTYLFEIVENADKIDGNMFRGTVAAKYIPVLEGKQAYILSIVDGKVGLYKAAKNGPDKKSFLSLSHRAYLLLDAAQQSNGFRLVFGTTAIEEVEAENKAEGIYDLSGRKLEGIYGPGIYIVNGKKVLVK